MLRTPNWLALAFVCALASPGSTAERAPEAQAVPFNLAPALDAYAAGRFDDARREFQRVTDTEARNLRAEWALSGLAWINAAPDNRSSRLLLAAALALESEAVRVERGDWAPVGPAACGVVQSVTGRAGGAAKDKNKPPPPPAVCVIEWARERLVERGAADAAEHAWFTAAIALAEGVRDLRYLYTPIDPARQPPTLPGLTDRALERFPGDTRFRLDRAIAAAARFFITTDGVTRMTASSPPPPPVIVINRGGGPPLASRASNERVGARGAAIAGLTELGDDPVVGAEAHLYLGYLHWATGNDDAARTELAAAARLAGDADLKYLANFLRGSAAQSAGDAPAAISAYTAALEARPDSQSATLALAALQLQRGQVAQADELARASFAKRQADDDPWRLFLYGRYPQLPAFLATLRAAVSR